MRRRKSGRHLRLTPCWLPAIRATLSSEIRKVAFAASDMMPGLNVSILQGIAGAMGVAPLWWVSEDMTAVCVDAVASGGVPKEAKLPADSGIMIFDGAFNVKLDNGMNLRVNGVFWMVAVGGGRPPRAHVFPLSDDEDVSTAKAYTQHVPIALVREGILSLMDYLILTDMVRTASALMSQPSITEVQRKRWNKAGTDVTAKPMDMGNPVTMIVLRQPRRTPHDDDGQTPRRRPCDHRYIVRGFYREQAYGPNHSLRRRQWIPPFVKGPEGAPLVITDSVRIWRRL